MLLGTTAEKLRGLGVETLGVVASKAERARLFFRYRPVRFAVGADPELRIHGAYGVPRDTFTPEIGRAIGNAYDRLARELKLDVSGDRAQEVIGRLDGFEVTESEGAEFQRHGVQLTAQVLVDRSGIVRWANIECAKEGLKGLDKFPTDDELLTEAGALRA